MTDPAQGASPTSLPDAAFAFAKECLKDARFAPTVGPNVVYTAQADWLRYTEFSAVMEAVKGWCDKHNHVLETSYFKGSLTARVLPEGVYNRDIIAWQH